MWINSCWKTSSDGHYKDPGLRLESLLGVYLSISYIIGLAFYLHGKILNTHVIQPCRAVKYILLNYFIGWLIA